MTALISPYEFTEITHQLRSFFDDRGFQEVHTQNRLSILAACEDPTTVSTYEYSGQIWPLPQTGQMWLEYELLTRPELPGCYCVSTSYRQEQNPKEGRHELIFPMFEFEAPGSFEDLLKLEEDLCCHLGFRPCVYPIKKYTEWQEEFNTTDELDHEHEELISKSLAEGQTVPSGVGFITHFPYSTSPFWNMKKEGDYANKCDVIIGGMETIGSAERSADPIEMREQFHTISDGEYASLLYELFGEERVEKELEEFLSHDFFPRFGGGIGLTRVISAMKGAKLIVKE
jgi:aspartyl/asparaginyl-tRNA synthetase